MARATSSACRTASNSFNTSRSLVDSSAFAPSDFAIFRIVVDFEKNSIYTGGHRGTRQHRDEFRLSSADRRAAVVGLCRRQLDRMRRVEYHGRKLAHDGKRAHIDNEIVVAETGTTLGQKNLRVARLAAFLHCVPHVPRRNELSFFDVYGAAAERSGDHEIGLAAQECRNLQHIDYFCDLRDITHFMNVGQNRNLQFALNFFQNAQAFFNAGSTKAANRSAIGFVIAGFEDERKTERPRDAFDDLGHANGMLFALNDARAGDEKEISRADVDIADLEGRNQMRNLLPPSTQRAPR